MKKNAVTAQSWLQKTANYGKHSEANQKFTSANTLLGSERICSVPKDKEYVVTDALKKSERVCYILFNNTGKFVHAEADIDKMNDGNGQLQT